MRKEVNANLVCSHKKNLFYYGDRDLARAMLETPPGSHFRLDKRLVLPSSLSLSTFCISSRFSTRASRRHHVSRAHERNHRCDVCQRKFYTNKSLLLHARTHARNSGGGKAAAPSSSSSAAEEGEETDTYLCLKCGAALCRAYGKMHEQKCTGVNVRHPEYK